MSTMYDDEEPDFESALGDEEPDNSWHAQALADEYTSRMTEAWEAGDTDTFQSYALQLAEVDPAAALRFTNEAANAAGQLYAQKYQAEAQQAAQEAVQAAEAEHVQKVTDWLKAHPEAEKNLNATTWGVQTVGALAPGSSVEDRLNEGLALGREAERASAAVAREAEIRQAFRQPTFRNGQVQTPMAPVPQVTEGELIDRMRPTPEARQAAHEQEVENFRAAFRAETAPRFARALPADEEEEVDA